jgi:hypothetical protein
VIARAHHQDFDARAGDLRGVGEVSDIAQAVLIYLEDAGFVTGETLRVTVGRSRATDPTRGAHASPADLDLSGIKTEPRGPIQLVSRSRFGARTCPSI